MTLETLIQYVYTKIDPNAMVWHDADEGIYVGHRNRYQNSMRLQNNFKSGPRQVLLYLNNVCDLRCRMCPRTYKPAADAAHMELALVQSVVDDMAVHHKKATLVFTGYGEPLLYSQLEDAISYSYKSGVYSILTTNGVALHEGRAKSILDSGVRSVFFSIDGMTSGTYLHMRGRDCLNRLKRNVETFFNIRDSSSEFSKRTKAVIQIILCKETEAEIMDFVAYYYPRMGASDVIRVKPINTRAGQVQVNKAINKDSRCMTEQGYAFCHRAEQIIVINFDGRTTVCCEDMDISLNVGEFRGSISAIWKGEKRKTLLNQIQSNQGQHLPKLCKQCNEWKRYGQWQKNL